MEDVWGDKGKKFLMDNIYSFGLEWEWKYYRNVPFLTMQKPKSQNS